MYDENKYKLMLRTTRIYNIAGFILAISFGLFIIALLYLFPSFPAGFIEGKTPLVQYLVAYKHAKLCCYIALGLLGITIPSFVIRFLITRKYGEYIIK